MKKYLPLILFLFVFASLVNAQTRWYGYTLTYNSPAYTKYVSFSMDDLGSVEIASDVHPQVATATYADGYVWSVNFDNASYTNNICKAKFNSASNLIEEPEVMVAGVYYGNLYRIDTNTGAYTNLGPLMNEGINYDLTCLFMTYGYELADEINVGNLAQGIYTVKTDNRTVKFVKE